ncbi:hypothetical protein CWI81_09655 [Idiomarina seosinensis]|uniref:Uncharacterized protein n=1 Tax=Idiomarina seosinensis TaxID=281739 RepID=A0A432ZBA5_9GAMM|nr:hypothetical protein CWI81_09655 [Idiomarina seosinensis]
MGHLLLCLMIVNNIGQIGLNLNHIMRQRLQLMICLTPAGAIKSGLLSLQQLLFNTFLLN